MKQSILNFKEVNELSKKDQKNLFGGGGNYSADPLTGMTVNDLGVPVGNWEWRCIDTKDGSYYMSYTNDTDKSKNIQCQKAWHIL
ncbi:hypothetical protein [Tenacibaculum xiamenense]|uniref:hypothetical protein n=1 Tax=Tenacibaculum xiamenense TaxID=1261553 RepID=UPI0038B4F64D